MCLTLADRLAGYHPSYAAQVSATLDDARRAEHDYERRNELHAAAVPSAFFEARLHTHRAEARLLLGHISQLQAATAQPTALAAGASSGAELSPSAVRTLLQQQARLFERAAARLQQQHAKTEGLRGRAKAR